MESNDIENVINLAIDNNYVPNSIKMAAVQTMTKVVTVFNSFFDILVIILVCACLFIIVSFGVKNIKSNMYEIGVLKAIGCKSNKFAFMFILHTLLMVVFIILFSYCGYYMFSGIANTVLVESIKKFAPSYMVIDLKFISFNHVIMLYDSFVVFIIAILSTFIPVNILRKIEPITIIKAKE